MQQGFAGVHPYYEPDDLTIKSTEDIEQTEEISTTNNLV